MWSQSRSGSRRPLLGKPGNLIALLSAIAALLAPLAAEAHVLQCVPYARRVSGIDIRGNARTWWSQAEGVYARGDAPRVGAVLAFKASGAMPYGHVATVARVIDDRHVLLDHANWSRPGMIEHGAMAVDVSDAGDWSEVRVWYAPSGSLGLRANPAYGFIYDAPAGEAPGQIADGTQLAANDAAPLVAQTDSDARMVLALARR
ncbi:MAG: CHAP domain-containing protein [Sphingomonadales bacterium]|nr:CHAP domain-containing protein [Sphingomonadales bacterium]MDE2569002.1 CHAP domain-containing protein [Sphingomonadales bacterium]